MLAFSVVPVLAEGLGVGVGVALGVGVGVALTFGEGVALGVGLGVGEGETVGVGAPPPVKPPLGGVVGVTPMTAAVFKLVLLASTKPVLVADTVTEITPPRFEVVNT